MTPAQNALYFREWAKVRAYYYEQGLRGAELEGKRHACTVKALGKDKSSKAFTNADFDKVLAVLRAVYDGGNLDAQLRQIDQPEQRHDDLVNRCWDAVRVFIRGNGRHNTEAVCERYMESVALRICKKHFFQLDERELGKVYGVLNRQATREEAKQREAHVATVASIDRRKAENDQPF